MSPNLVCSFGIASDRQPELVYLFSTPDMLCVENAPRSAYCPNFETIYPFPYYLTLAN